MPYFDLTWRALSCSSMASFPSAKITLPTQQTYGSTPGCSLLRKAAARQGPFWRLSLRFNPATLAEVPKPCGRSVGRPKGRLSGGFVGIREKTEMPTYPIHKWPHGRCIYLPFRLGLTGERMIGE